MKVPVLHSVMAAVMVTLILNTKMVDGVLNTEFLDSRGLFIAIFAALISVELIGLFIRKILRFELKGYQRGLRLLLKQSFH